MTGSAVTDEDGATPWRRQMLPRDREEPHRASTPLELLFDLCFVVAVAQAADRLHHALADGHTAAGVLSYAMAFFAIWWAWMNFTWFASASDADDVPYRLLTLLQIAGVLVLAAGVPAAFDGDFKMVTAGYVLMRVAMVTQWLRVARDHPAGRTTAVRYAAGIAVVQAGWLALLAVPRPWNLAGFVLLAASELAVPVWAERAGQPIAWHPGHIAERYGLFTLIVLGESVLAATVAVQSGLVTSGLSAPLIIVAAGGLVLLFTLWWSYFGHPAAEGLRLAPGGAFRWGYGHVLVFACLAAVGAGLQVNAETVGHHTHLSARVAALSLAAPVALYLVTIGLLHTSVNRHRAERVAARFTVAAVLVVLPAVATPPIPLALTVAVVGSVVAGLVAADLVAATGTGRGSGGRRRRARRR